MKRIFAYIGVALLDCWRGQRRPRTFRLVRWLKFHDPMLLVAATPASLRLEPGPLTKRSSQSRR